MENLNENELNLLADILNSKLEPIRESFQSLGILVKKENQKLKITAKLKV
jgi:hypothetical protein